MIINPDTIESNQTHEDIQKSSYLHPYIKNADDLIDWGLAKLGYPLQQVELSKKQIEICMADAIELYSKYASFDIQDLIVPLSGYTLSGGLDLSEYNIADIHDISFRRDTLLYGFGEDIMFGQYAMMQGYAGSGIFPWFNAQGTAGSGSWVSLHSLYEHLEMINRLTGSRLQWRYFKNSKILKITPAPKLHNNGSDLILLTCEVEPPPEELYGNEYVKRIFLAKLKIQLGVVRKKFSSVQLIGGGTIDTTIGDEGKEEMNQILEQLRQDESFGNLAFVGE